VPVPVAALSNTLMLLDLSNAGILGSNNFRALDICPRFSVLCCGGKGLALGRSPVQGVALKCQNGFMVSQYILIRNTPDVLISEKCVRVKLSLCFNRTPCYEGVLGSGGIAPRIFYLCTRWR
jgi:hypothetical protein